MLESFALQTVTSAFTSWYDIKMFIERSAAVSTDALHVIAGVLFQLLVAIVSRRPIASWLPWLSVMALLVFNEAVDLWIERWPSLAMQLGEAVKDFFLTMMLPTVLMLSLKFRPALGIPYRG